MKILINTGSSVVGFFQETGKISIFIVHIFKAALSRWYLKNIFTQLVSIGYLSLPVVALTSFFTGGALAIQIYYGGNQFNSEIIVSSIVALGITRELGPVLGGIVVAGRVSAAIAAELGTMKVTEQIDALEIMGVNPKSYLIMPKVVAALFVFPFIVIVSIFLGVTGGYIASLLTGTVSIENYVFGIKFDFF